MSNSKYTEEFRTSTVQLIINSNRSVREVSEDLGVHEKLSGVCEIDRVYTGNYTCPVNNYR